MEAGISREGMLKEHDQFQYQHLSNLNAQVLVWLIRLLVSDLGNHSLYSSKWSILVATGQVLMLVAATMAPGLQQRVKDHPFRWKTKPGEFLQPIREVFSNTFKYSTVFYSSALKVNIPQHPLYFFQFLTATSVSILQRGNTLLPGLQLEKTNLICFFF